MIRISRERVKALALRAVALVAMCASVLGMSCPPTGGGGGLVFSTPPTFVLAWNGPGGTIRTVESAGGRTWSGARTHTTVVAGSRGFGPTIAHDGVVSWMVMWKNGPELQFVTGLGGAAGTGITWESSPNVGLINAVPESSPALAYGAGRWMAAYRGAGGQLRIVRSAANSATSWEAPLDVRIGSGGTSRPVTAVREPALAHGTLGGSNLFVLLYRNSSLEGRVVTSTDGLAWSGPFTVGPEVKSPALAFSNGVLYAALTQSLRGTTLGGFETTIYKSADAQNWREAGTILRTAQSATGPGFTVGECHFLMTEQIGGALGGTFGGVSQRRADNIVRACGGGGPGSGTLVFGNDEAVRPGGGAIISVGNSAARTALAFADTTPLAANAAEVDDICLTQSGLVEDCPATATLVVGKTSMLRVRMRSRVGGQPAPIDEAWAEIVNTADGSVVASIQGVAFAADNTTLVTTIGDDQDAHFFIPGNLIRMEMDVRVDLTLTRGGAAFLLPGVVPGVAYRLGRGIPLATVGYDLQPPTTAAIAAELTELARMYPVADGVGTMTAASPPAASVIQGGVRFVQSPTQALQVAGPGVPFVNGFVLVNRITATMCTANSPFVLFNGRTFAFNFTNPEELDGVPGFSAAELANCQGDPTPLGVRYANMMAQLDTVAAQQKLAINSTRPNDPAKFAVSVVTGGGAGQDRSGLVGQCPDGLSSSRRCWAVVGQTFPSIQHELGHAFGLDHNDNLPAPSGMTYHLLNRIRIPTPQVTMRALIGGTTSAFFLADEYRRLHDTLASSTYAALASRERASPPVALPAANAAAARPVLLVSGSVSTGDRVEILRTRVLSSHETPRGEGDEYMATLLDQSGERLAGMHFSPTSSNDRADLPAVLRKQTLPRQFIITLPYPAGARRFVIERAGARLLEVRISARAPELRLTQPTLGRITEPVTVTWQASDPDGDALEYDVYLRGPNRERRALATGLRTPAYVIEPGTLPGGTRLALEVVATDGFNATTRTIPGIELPNTPPSIAIVHPPDQSRVPAHGLITLRAVAADLESGVLADGAILWHSSLDGDLGEGGNLLIRFESTGTHAITATARDPDGGEARSAVTVQVVKD